MNLVISGLVGTALAFTLTIGGVNAVNGDPKSVSQQQLYSYADD
jgi:hypothetical protein